MWRGCDLHGGVARRRRAAVSARRRKSSFPAARCAGRSSQGGGAAAPARCRKACGGAELEWSQSCRPLAGSARTAAHGAGGLAGGLPEHAALRRPRPRGCDCGSSGCGGGTPLLGPVMGGHLRRLPIGALPGPSDVHMLLSCQASMASKRRLVLGIASVASLSHRADRICWMSGFTTV